VLGLGVELDTVLVLPLEAGGDNDGVALVAGLFDGARELVEVLRHLGEHFVGDAVGPPKGA